MTLLDSIDVSKKADSLDHQAQIIPGSETFQRELICPLNVGSPTPGSYDLGDILQRARTPSEGLTLAVVEGTEYEGRDVMHLAITSGAARRDYWVDLERGAVPLRIESSEGGTVERLVVYEDLRQVGGRGWLPHRQTIYFSESGLTKQLTVSKSNFDSPVDHSAFRMEFPEPMAIINTAVMTRYAPQKVWDLSNLPSPSSPKSRRIVLSEPGPPAATMAGERSPWPVWAMPVILLGAVALGGVGWSYYRRRGYAGS